MVPFDTWHFDDLRDELTVRNPLSATEYNDTINLQRTVKSQFSLPFDSIVIKNAKSVHLSNQICLFIHLEKETGFDIEHRI